MKSTNFFLSVSMILTFTLTGCKKNFLAEKPSTEIVEPITIESLTALLDNDVIYWSSPALGLLSDDDFEFLSFNVWQSAPTYTERNAYVWSKDLYGGETEVPAWSRPYHSIYYANVVLENYGRLNITASNRSNAEYVKGWALFFRAYNYYNLVSTFSKAYSATTASQDLGVPLKLSPRIDETFKRSSLQECYSQIFSDLNDAKLLLGNSYNSPSGKKNRPSKAAIYALEARIYLSMREYKKAEESADNCLNIYSRLIDFKNLNLPGTFPFFPDNEETLFSTSTSEASYATINALFNNFIRINPTLITQYVSGDLRPQAFMVENANGYLMGGNFFGYTILPYTGLASDEVYLVKAECATRSGNIAEGLKWLNALLEKRFAANTFIPYTATSSQEALAIILAERRKELVRRGSRWIDLKRLNAEGAGITLTRTLNGTTYTLPPNDPRYVFPLPDDEIQTGLEQNNR